jgi:hypothetical protein
MYAIILMIMFQTIGSTIIPSIAHATWIQDNAAGTATINFVGNLAGISAGSNYLHNPSGIGTMTSL